MFAATVFVNLKPVVSTGKAGNGGQFLMTSVPPTGNAWRQSLGFDDAKWTPANSSTTCPNHIFGTVVGQTVLADAKPVWYPDCQGTADDTYYRLRLSIGATTDVTGWLKKN